MPHGKQLQCKSCRKQDYIENREYILLKYKEYYVKTRPKRIVEYRELVTTILDHYGASCVCCGETHRTFLCIDHVNNDGNKELNGAGNRLRTSQLFRKIIKDGFPDRYQVLCMNCNHSKMRNGGVCEHLIEKHA
jgi:hypothetical protein